MGDNRIDPPPDRTQDKEVGLDPAKYWTESAPTTMSTTTREEKTKADDTMLKEKGFKTSSELLGDDKETTGSIDKKEVAGSTDETSKIETSGGDPKRGDGTPEKGKPDPNSKKTGDQSEKTDSRSDNNGQTPMFVAALSDDKTPKKEPDKDSTGKSEKTDGEPKESTSGDRIPVADKDDKPKTDADKTKTAGALTPEMRENARKALGLPNGATDKEISDGIKGEVDKLKADTYQERQDAEKKLREMGPAAAEQLLSAVSQKNADPELSKRAMGILKDIARTPNKEINEQFQKLNELGRATPTSADDHKSTQELQTAEAKANRMRDDFFNDPKNAKPAGLTPKEAEGRKHYSDLLSRFAKENPGSSNLSNLQDHMKTLQSIEQGVASRFARELATKAVNDFTRAGGDAGPHDAKMKAHDTLGRAMNIDKNLVNSDKFQLQAERTGADLNPKFRADWLKNGGSNDKMAELGNMRRMLRQMERDSQK